jgi:glucokinase
MGNGPILRPRRKRHSACAIAVTGSLRLLGDIGATKAQFALLQPDGEIGHDQTIAVADHEDLAGAIAAYLAHLSGAKPVEAALAIAAPVTGDSVAMMNAPWRFSLQAIQRQFGWTELHAVNDFAANALSVPQLSPEHLAQLGEGAPVSNEAIAVLGAGTGLGVGALVPTGEGWIALPGEGGHATLAAFDSREAAIIDILRRQYAPCLGRARALGAGTREPLRCVVRACR